MATKKKQKSRLEELLRSKVTLQKQIETIDSELDPLIVEKLIESIPKARKEQERDRIFLEWSENIFLVNTHSKERCRGENCTIHNRSENALRGWPQHYRSDRGIMERISPWGVGCPDLDDPCHKSEYGATHGCVVNPFIGWGGVCSPWEIEGSQATWVNKRVAVTKNGRIWAFSENNEVDGGTIYRDPVECTRFGHNSAGTQFPSNVTDGLPDIYGPGIILRAWKGQPPSQDHRPNFIDGNPFNWNLSNLEYKNPNAVQQTS